MRSAKSVLRHTRVLGLAVSLTIVFLIIHRVHFYELKEHLRSMRIEWFAAATLLYGLLFVPAACRWHLALRLTHCEVDIATSLRVSLIGHFFYTILFGAAGGDVAKSALYARRYGLPLTKILAASSVDRLLGCGGLILFAVTAFTIALLHNESVLLSSLTLRFREWWLLLIAVAIVLAVAGWRRTSSNSAWRRFVEALAISARKLIASPAILATGLLCGLLVQLALSGVLALNLQAVSHSPVPWGRMAWTFPVITTLSALPISVAGLGVRDSAAFMLFGLFHIAGADAIAASLLTAGASLIWTVVGGILFGSDLWREPDSRGETDLLAAGRPR